MDLRLFDLAQELGPGMCGGAWLEDMCPLPSTPTHKTSRHGTHGNCFRAGLEFHFWPSLDGE